MPHDTFISMLAAYELEGEGLDGHQKFFRKPWAMATIMFLGMSFCLPFAYIEEARARSKQRSTADLERDAAAAPLLGDAYVRRVHHDLTSCQLKWPGCIALVDLAFLCGSAAVKALMLMLMLPVPGLGCFFEFGQMDSVHDRACMRCCSCSSCRQVTSWHHTVANS